MTWPTKRALEREVENLHGDERFPQAGLITILSTASNGGTIELIDRKRLLYRIDGEIMRVHPSLLKVEAEST